MEHFKHLSKDKIFRTIIKGREPVLLLPRKKVYLQLCASIISQQLSTTVAKVIFNRFLDLYKTKQPSLKQIADTPLSTFRSIGFSNAKASYVHNVCKFIVEYNISDARLAKMSNEDIIDLLTQIKGVGKWTVEMILMFTLGREDVFAVDDLGIQKAITKLYELDATDKKAMKEKMLEISENWSPYRTYACRYLWNSLDVK